MKKSGSLVVGAGLAVAAVLGFSSSAFQAAEVNSQNNWVVEKGADGSGDGNIDLDTTLTAPLFSAGLDGAPAPKWKSNATNSAYDAPIAAGSGISNRDIQVNYTGKVNPDVRLYVDGTYSATDSLDTKTTVMVKADVNGDATAETIYSGPLSSFPKSYSAAAATSWKPVMSATPGNSADDAKSLDYTISITTAADSVANSSVSGLTFKWDAQQATA